MKEISVQTWCDQCGAEGSSEPGETTPPIVVGARKARTLDLCEAHRKELLEPLLSLLSDSGAPVNGPSTASPDRRPASGAKSHRGTPRAGTTWTKPDDEGKRYACPDPDCETHTIGSGSFDAWKQHMRAVHGLLVSDVVEKYGRPRTLDGSLVEVAELPPVGAPKKADRWTCGVDGCRVRYDPDEHKRPQQALTTHRIRNHDWQLGMIVPSPA